MENKKLYRYGSFGIGFNLAIISWLFVIINLECFAEEGEWSKQAIRRSSSVRQEIPAPDGRKLLIINGTEFYVFLDRERIAGTEDIGVGSLAEFGWAPDSSAFFITESLGGWAGEWIVRIFLIDKDRSLRPVISELDVTQYAVNEFKKHCRCKETQNPEIGAVTWLEGSSKILLATEVPKHSNCSEMGKIKAYILSVPSGKIVKQITAKELRTVWKDYLGTRFETEKKWPPMSEFDMKIGIDTRSEKIYFEIPLRDIKGQIQSTLICRGGTVEYLDAFSDTNKIIYTPDLGFRLYAGTKEVEASLLSEDDSAAWHSRGHVRYSQLTGACGRYSEYGMLRHFRLRGFELALEFFDIRTNPEEIPTYLNLKISLRRSPKATRAQAEQPGYLDPERAGRSCDKVIKGKDLIMRRNKQGSYYESQE